MPGANLTFDLAGLEAIDGGSMALLVQLRWDLESKGAKCAFEGASAGVEKLLALYHAGAPDDVAPPVPALGLGDRVIEGLGEVQRFLDFIGCMTLALLGVLRHPSTANLRDVAVQMVRSGVSAIPIVLLVTFLIGFVMAFQSAVQLRQFGADIYVADLVGLSITRELGPLMTAIIVCGRSGAAFAAELGTMSVSEEIDALRTMGIGPLRSLVFPRILALILVLPILTLFGDVVGMLGGLLVGVENLHLSVTGYVQQTQRALHPWDVYQGLLKAGVFGLAIGLIACAQGLATTGGAEGVGRRTTSAVVTSIFALIVVDAIFTLAFHELGL